MTPLASCVEVSGILFPLIVPIDIPEPVLPSLISAVRLSEPPTPVPLTVLSVLSIVTLSVL